MRTIAAEPFELISFFECEPQLASDDPWPYADALYEVRRGAMSLSVSIHPAHRDVRIVLAHDGTTAYELNAMGVADVRYGKDERYQEVLEVVLTPRVSVNLQVNPTIRVWQELELET